MPPDSPTGPENPSRHPSSRGNSGMRQWAPPSPEELSRLLPQYQIEAILGRGGMGVVYKGMQVSLRRPVAVKLLPAELAGDEEFAARFQREAYTLARLQHPGIVGVYDSGQTGEGHFYFVMEFVDGTDLAQVIRSTGVDPGQAMEIIGQICDALHYAHSQGVIHRDIKPANVLLTKDCRAKLADFGLARPADMMGQTMLTATNVIMGTPDYMAPEQMMGITDQRSDIYALGIMFYQMLTGQVPKGHFAMPSAFGRGDARLDAVVSKAIQQFPEHRFQDVSEVKTAIEQLRLTPVPEVRQAPATGAAAAPSQKSRNVVRQGAPVPQGRPSSRAGLPFFTSMLVALLAISGGAWFLLMRKAPPRMVTDEAAMKPATGAPVNFDAIPKSYVDTLGLKPSQASTTPVTVPTNKSASPSKPADNTYAGIVGTIAKSPVGTSPQPASAAPPPPNPELVALEKQYLSAIEKQVTPAVEAYAKSIIPSYGNALDRASKAAGVTAAEATALKAEMQRLTSNGRVPDTDPPGTPQAIVALRTTYRKAVEAFRVDKTAPLKAIYDGQVTVIAARQGVDADGYKLLLNKNDTDGWQTCGDGGIAVNDGVARIWKSGSQEACPWYAKSPFGDFILKLDYQITKAGGNSGVYVRLPKPGQDPRVRLEGYQIDVSDAPPGLEATGAICGIKPPSLLPQRPGAWNELEIDVKGQRYLVRVNGVLVNNFTGNRLTSGYIGLQCYRPDGVLFRNIRIKELAPAPYPASPGGAPTAVAEENSFSNSLGMRFVRVPGTEVLFCIHETRRQDYAAFAAQVRGVDDSWRNQLREGIPCGDRDDHPVVGVSWDDAKAFCAWLGNREGRAYRLPTDKEWSWAVGIGEDESRVKDPTPEVLDGGQTTALPWAGTFPPRTQDRAGNYADTAWKQKFPQSPFIRDYTDGFPTTAPVMSFRPNELGLYDLGGSVWEWTEDWYDAKRTERVQRGASFSHYDLDRLLSSARYHRPSAHRGNADGFRVVVEKRSR